MCAALTPQVAMLSGSHRTIPSMDSCNPLTICSIQWAVSFADINIRPYSFGIYYAVNRGLLMLVHEDGA